MKKIIISYFLILLPFYISCTSYYSLDQTLHIDSVGLDYDSKTNTYELFYHIASSSSLVTTELGGATTEQLYSIGHTKAPNIYEGINELTSNSIKNIVLTHIQSFILTLEFITIENLRILSDIIKTYDMISPNIYLFATNSPLEDIYSIENPENISPFFSIISSNDFVTTYNLVYFTELGRTLSEDYLINKFIIIEASKEYWQNQDEKITTVSPIGDFYIDDNNKSLFLLNKEYKALLLFNHEDTSTVIFDDINFTIFKQKIRITEKDSVFYIKLSGLLYITNVNEDNQNKMIDLFNRNVIKEVEKLIQKSVNSNLDILNLRDILYRKNKLNIETFDLSNIKFVIESDYKYLA